MSWLRRPQYRGPLRGLILILLAYALAVGLGMAAYLWDHPLPPPSVPLRTHGPQ